MSENDLKDERWVILDAIPKYSISSYGRVVNNETGYELKHSINPITKRLKVRLSHNGIKYDVYVHRLVARCFFVNYQDNIEVLHKSGDFSDCSVLNLTLGRVMNRSGKHRLGKG